MVNNRVGSGFLVLILYVLGSTVSWAGEYEQCLLDALERADDSTTVAELKNRCDRSTQTSTGEPSSNPLKRSKQGLIERRLRLEQAATSNRFAMVQHKSSYILPLSYNNSVNNDPFLEAGEPSDLDNYEVKFQFSIKAQLFDSILRRRGRIFVGYTNQSYWQLYDQSNSAPFRETNHQPEIFADFDRDWDIAGWHVPVVRTGWIHESNGRSAPFSRSWNRIFAQVFLEKNNWAISFKPWVRVNGDSARIDNPDIEDFMGNFELGIFRQGDTSAASLLLRNNLRSENRGAIEFNWSKPLPYSKKLRFLFQYFNGYGESLIDYNASTNRVSMGLQLSDFL